ncbi:MAG: phosphoribosylformylglycinamidine synthase subunit PurL [Pseudomonadota bacterium]
MATSSATMAARALEPEVTGDLAAAHGLSEEEFAAAERLVNRPLSFTELGIVSAMWNEHCSYKSSKVWLRTLPTEGPQVIQGPGENAGVVDIGEGLAVVFKMESHNHPSYIEPYQGAATGVGGILRDVFTMGARPVAALNALSFGAPDHPKTASLLAGAVAGIGGYGNAFGVPTVGGELRFDAAYNGNCLVNAFAAGIVRQDAIFYAAASGVGMPVVYLGAKTGRDGVGGATMASAEFGEGTEEKRPTVQIGDPFTEKRLLEACLALMESGAVIAIQDMGAAGLTCSAVEMGDKGGLGVRLNLDRVPTREADMSAYEIMLSESQERMLMLLRPEKTDVAMAILADWDLDFAIVGETIAEDRFIIEKQGAVAADLPLSALSGAAPEYQRPWVAPPSPAPAGPVPEIDPAEALLRLVASPNIGSRRAVWQQYDHSVMADTVLGPGADAALVRVHGTERALAFSADVTPRYCVADPAMGGRQAVAEAYRNVSATGATPLATTDCLNFGNPERPEIMGQFKLCIDGIGEACRALATPIVSGNVSLYNETDGRAILPTPTIGMVGLIEDWRRAVGITPRDGDALILLGETHGHLGASALMAELFARADGPPPPVDLAAEAAHGAFVRALIAEGAVSAVHDIADGGMAVAAAEMALAAGCGVALDTAPDAMDPVAWAFGEDQARYLLAAPDAAPILDRARPEGLPITLIGRFGGPDVTLGPARLALAELSAAHEGALSALLPPT